MGRNIMYVVLAGLLTLGASYAFAGENGNGSDNGDKDRTQTRDCYLPDNAPQQLLAGENGNGSDKGDKDRTQTRDC